MQLDIKYGTISSFGPQIAGLVISRFRQSLETFLFGQSDNSSVWTW